MSVSTTASIHCCNQPFLKVLYAGEQQKCCAVLPHVTTPQPTEGWQAGGKEGAWGPVSADTQMGKQENINKETRETLPVLSCFCLCKEEEMFVKPISQNGLPLTARGPAKPPLHTSLHPQSPSDHAQAAQSHLWGNSLC